MEGKLDLGEGMNVSGLMGQAINFLVERKVSQLFWQGDRCAWRGNASENRE